FLAHTMSTTLYNSDYSKQYVISRCIELMVLVMLTHHGAHGKLKLFHLEDGGFNHQRDYKIYSYS
ncbi:MAG: hypothetical protein O7C56_02450, partial [Rickettsia endosymbiont of Ixodes persulcatus]|nr:hypothetical protein [Rickettsia endosymbiont of Ixodes persulcatus]